MGERLSLGLDECFPVDFSSYDNHVPSSAVLIAGYLRHCELPPLTDAAAACCMGRLVLNFYGLVEYLDAPPATPKENNDVVLKHFAIARDRDFKAVLSEHEVHIIQFRDEAYANALQSNITIDSKRDERLKVLGAVVEYVYNTVQPPNQYTKITDRSHFKQVASMCISLCKERSIKDIPLTLIVAAWYHDIERYIPCIKCAYLPEKLDWYRKQVIHPLTSGRVARVLLEGGPITPQETDRVFNLILRHDSTHPTEDMSVCNTMLLHKASDDLIWELRILTDADAFVFFKCTLAKFIEYKGATNSCKLIWDRIVDNWKRLSPALRPAAAQYVDNLPDNVISTMKFNLEDLRACDDEVELSSSSAAFPF